jgi:hypothetical protein
MKLLLDLIYYMGVRLSGVDSLSLAPASTISSILRLRVSFSLADVFAYTCSMSLFFCFFPHQPLQFEGVPSLSSAALLPLLSYSSPSLSSLRLSSTLLFHSPPPPPCVLAVTALPILGCIIDIVATRGAVPPPPRERAMWA